MKKINYPEEYESNIDDLLDRVPKENKYMVTTTDLINYCYNLEYRINKAIEYMKQDNNELSVDSYFKFKDLCEFEDLLKILRGEDK